jgi:hypothetical protein
LGHFIIFLEDEKTRRQEDKETRRQEDEETRRREGKKDKQEDKKAREQDVTTFFKYVTIWGRVQLKTFVF